MKNNKFSLTSVISLIGAYASYLIPLVLVDKLTGREVIIITFFSSLLCLTIFFATVSSTLDNFLYKIKCLENSQETSKLRISILKEESEYLKSLIQGSQEKDI